MCSETRRRKSWVPRCVLVLLVFSHRAVPSQNSKESALLSAHISLGTARKEEELANSLRKLHQSYALLLRVSPGLCTPPEGAHSLSRQLSNTAQLKRWIQYNQHIFLNLEKLINASKIIYKYYHIMCGFTNIRLLNIRIILTPYSYRKSTWHPI